MRLSTTHFKYAFYAALLLFGLLIPAITTDRYYLHVAIIAYIASIAALGVRAMLNTGQWNFGQAGLLAIGAFISAILVDRYMMNFWATVWIAAVCTSLIAMVIGYPILRLKGAYFGILTITLVVAINQIILIARDWTGGAVGIYNLAPINPLLGVDFVASKVPAYYFALGMVLAMVAAYALIEQSRIGKLFGAIRQADTLAESVGVDIARYKVIAYVTASFFAGMAGAYSGHYFRLAHPDTYDMWPSIYYVAYTITGGSALIVGPIIGSFVLIVVQEALRPTYEWQAAILAAIFIGVIMFLPGGMVSLPSVLLDLFRKRNALLRALVEVPDRVRGRPVAAKEKRPDTG